jgi:ubiquitin
MRKLRTAVIGCGLISKNHFKALKNLEDAFLFYFGEKSEEKQDA